MLLFVQTSRKREVFISSPNRCLLFALSFVKRRNNANCKLIKTLHFLCLVFKSRHRHHIFHPDAPLTPFNQHNARVGAREEQRRRQAGHEAAGSRSGGGEREKPAAFRTPFRPLLLDRRYIMYWHYY